MGLCGSAPALVSGKTWGQDKTQMTETEYLSINTVRQHVKGKETMPRRPGQRGGTKEADPHVKES